MKAHLIDSHLLVSRSRSSAKVKVKCQGTVSQKMGVSGALVFHKNILFYITVISLILLKIFTSNMDRYLHQTWTCSLSKGVPVLQRQVSIKVFLTHLCPFFYLKLSLKISSVWVPARGTLVCTLTHSLIHHSDTTPNSKKLQMTTEMWLLKDFKVKLLILSNLNFFHNVFLMLFSSIKERVKTKKNALQQI